jgi:hypothetical protein
VACFVKQVGRLAAIRLGLKDRKHGADPREWPARLRVQQFPKGRDIDPVAARRSAPVSEQQEVAA